MGKYLGYVILILTLLFALEWFQVVDVPVLEIPDYLSGKRDMVESTEAVLDQME
ncbi:MAG: hypothetical protein QNJ22_07120 [Desulfosarcinaceae bacterium]|nr:hypothetical protein [Desulfosarcinaceae bacterium]